MKAIRLNGKNHLAFFLVVDFYGYSSHTLVNSEKDAPTLESFDIEGTNDKEHSVTKQSTIHFRIYTVH